MEGLYVTKTRLSPNWEWAEVICTAKVLVHLELGFRAMLEMTRFEAPSACLDDLQFHTDPMSLHGRFQH